MSLVHGCAALSPCDTSDHGNPPDRYGGGTVVDGVFMTSTWAGPLLPLPGGKRYEIEHKLGCVPSTLGLWVSFSEGGSGEGNVTPSAGNMTLVQEINSEFILVKNDTCSDYFLLVTAGPGCLGGSEVDAGGDSQAEAALEAGP